MDYHPTLIIYILSVAFFSQSFAVNILDVLDDTVINASKTIKIGILTPISLQDKAIPAAPFLARREVRRRLWLQDYNIEIKFGDTFCAAGSAMKAAVKLHTSERLDGIVGDVCSISCHPIGLLAAAWNIPEISYKCFGDPFSDKSTFPTFSRVTSTVNQYVPVIVAVLKYFGWDSLAIVTSTLETYQQLAEQVKISCEDEGMYVFYYTFEPFIVGEVILENELEIQKRGIREIKVSTRVVLIMQYMQDIRNFLVHCYDEGMLNGEYQFFGTESMFYPDNYMIYRPELSDEFLRHGAMVVAQDISETTKPPWLNFIKNVREIADTGVFQRDYGFQKNDIPSSEQDSAYLHDAFLLLAYGMNKTLADGGLPNDGVKVTSEIMNSRLEGITGKMIIDSKGDRLRDFRVMILQNGKPVKLLHWSILEQKFYKQNDTDWSKISWVGNTSSPPLGYPKCGWKNELCEKQNIPFTTYISMTIILAFVVCVLLSLITLRHWRENRMIKVSLVPWSMVTKLDQSLKSHASLNVADNTEWNTNEERIAKFQQKLVLVRIMGTSLIPTSLKAVQQELLDMRTVQHENINSFLGLCLDGNRNGVLMLFAERGSLHDLIHNDVTNLPLDIKQSLITDIAKGMQFLHHTNIKYHGHLSSYNCVVDHRWICKITDYGLMQVTRLSHGGLLPWRDRPAEKLLWMAPELLRQETSDVTSLQAADVYSFGIILQELLAQDHPYALNVPPLSAQEIIDKLKNGEQVHPTIPEDFSHERIIHIANLCLNWNKFQRPSFKRIFEILLSLNDGKEESFVDKMIIRLENHTQQLEFIVDKRSQELREEQHKVEMLLKELLPVSIINDIKLGRPVQPEMFEEVTIFFSDIVSFTRISAAGTPLDIVRMLNLMYTMYDDVSSQFDVYKVATIGDAYFVASGVPIRNGNKHAREIADMAIALLQASSNFYIPHLAGETLKIRIGVHCGSCVAGLVGVKTPRYLLFGDTVDTASHMESSGEAMKIHVSDKAASLMMKHPHLILTKRGYVDIKGIGQIKTFWLETKLEN